MGVQRFCVATAAVTFLLLLVGGIVHGTGSSLACPDWPTCFGSFFPEMKGGVFFEHGHRLLASAVGLMTIGLTLWTWRSRSEPRLRRLAAGALALVIFQGILGGITVIYKLPPAVSSAHLAVSMIFFSLLIVLAFGLRVKPVAGLAPAGTRRWVGLTGSLVYAQIVLGGVVRHTGAGLACTDLPLCKGTLWPTNFHLLVRLHMAHRIAGVLVALAVLLTSVHLLRRVHTSGRVRTLALLAPLLVLVQVTLGLLSVSSYLSLPIVTAHLGGGALLLATFVCLWMLLEDQAEPLVGAAAERAGEAAAKSSALEACS